ncbi:MAG: hypothetical protein ABI972_12485 [Acidobacteriota bacterium]
MSFPRHALALFALATLLTAGLHAGSVIQMPASSSDPNPIGTVYGTTPLTAGQTFPASIDTYAIFTRPTAIPTDVTYWVVSKAGTNILRVLNNTFQPLSSVNLGTNSAAAAMSPDGNRFVMITGTTLRIYNAATLEQVPLNNNPDVGLSPSEVVISHDSKLAFIMSGLGQKVTAFDLTNNQVVGSIPLPGITTGFVTIAPNGLLYVSAQNKILEINPKAVPFDSTAIRRQFTLTGNVGKVSFTPDGTRALAANQNTSVGPVLYYINIADSAGGIVTVPTSDPVLAGNFIDKIYITGNNRAYGISTANSTAPKKLFQITLPDLPAPGVNIQVPTVVEAFFGSLSTIPIVEGLAFSREYPAAKQLFVSAPLATLPSSLVPSVLYQIDTINNNLQSQVNLPYAPGFIQFVDPVQSANTAAVGQVITLNNGQPAIPVNSKSLPIGVKVMTANGEPIFGLPVVFSANVQGASFEGGNTVNTNADGYAFVTVIAPPTSGTFSITATPSGSSFVVGFTLVSGASTGGGGGGGGGPIGTTLDIVDGDGQIIRSGSPAPKPMILRVLDAAGKPQGNVQITWTVTQGTGYFLEGTNVGESIVDKVTTTDATGTTQNTFQAPVFTASFGDVAVQSVVTASTVAQSVNLYTTTIALVGSDGNPVTNPGQEIRLNGVPFDQSQPDVFEIVGKVGETLLGAIKVRYTMPHPRTGSPIQNASFSLSSDKAPDVGPGARCVPKANPLSGVDGIASCDVQLTGKAGTALLTLDLAGIGAKYVNLKVTPGDATNLVIVQGNGQSVKPGDIVPAAFQARVTDAAGNPLQGYIVRWQVLTGSATFGSSGSGTTSQDTTSNAQGIVSVTVKAGNSPGPVSIRANIVVSSAPTASANFGLSVIQTATTVRKPATGSGDNQSAFTNANFPSALVVEVLDATSTPVLGATVDFAIVSGTATLTSAASVQTSASGRAQVTVRAGANAGPITIRATVPSLTPVTFTLNVNLPGPVIGINSFRNAASGEFGAVTPGGLVTITGDGVAPGVNGIIYGSGLLGAWPTRLNGVEVQFGNTLAPIYRLANLDGVQSVTVQVPFDLQPNTQIAVILRSGGGSTTVSSLPVVDYQPGLFETIDQNNRRYAVAIRSNGTYVTPENPARTGEIIRIFVTGLGQTAPSIIAGQTGSGQVVLAEIVVGLNDAGVRVVSSTYSPNLVGIYEVAFEVPAATPQSQLGPTRPLAVVAVRPNGQFVYGNGSNMAVSQ